MIASAGFDRGSPGFRYSLRTRLPVRCSKAVDGPDPGQDPGTDGPKYAGAPIEWVVERLNLTLRGWGNYFRWGNSNRKFHDIDSYVHWRLAKLTAVKYGQRGRGWASRHDHAWIDRLGVHQLTGAVRYRTAHATR